jgi:hypothetical protein
MNYAGLEALAGKGGTSPAKASSPALVFSLSTRDKASFERKLKNIRRQ